jgi:hypothetical protein
MVAIQGRGVTPFFFFYRDVVWVLRVGWAPGASL